MAARGYRGRLVLGWVLLSVGLVFFAASLGLLFERQKIGAGLFGLFISFLVFVLPGALLVAGAIRTKRRGVLLDRLSGFGAAASRIPLGEIAEDLGVSVAEARRLVLDAASTGLIKGRFDADAGVFYSSAADASVAPAEATCGSCGAKSTVLRVGAEALRCPYCGASVS